MESAAAKLFGKKEILFTEKFYLFIQKKKIVTFVPLKYADKLTGALSDAGAGIIGNYRMCSFRTEGTGTFLPTSKANPFSGAKMKLSFVQEIKLEMECNAGDLNNVIDALYKNHPYEEVAYEIYSFIKRKREQAGTIVVLKNEVLFSELLKKASKKISTEHIDIKFKIKKIAFIKTKLTANVKESAKILNCCCIIESFRNNFKIYIIKK